MFQPLTTTININVQKLSFAELLSSPLAESIEISKRDRPAVCAANSVRPSSACEWSPDAVQTTDRSLGNKRSNLFGVKSNKQFATKISKYFKHGS